MRSSYQGESVSSAHCHERALGLVFIPRISEFSIDFVGVSSVAVSNDVVGTPWFEAAQPLADRDPLRVTNAMSRDLGDIIHRSKYQYVDCHFLLLKSLSILFLDSALLGVILNIWRLTFTLPCVFIQESGDSHR